MGDTSLQGKTIVLGISGGIAAYKAAELASTLVQRGANVPVVMTENATRFIQPLTLTALTGRAVAVNMFDERSVANFDHITLTEESDLLVIAPATANVLAKIAAGIADDLLTATVLATRSQVLIVPAMNTHMWNNPATVANLETLRGRGYRFVDPEAGRLACGAVGAGRLASLDRIVCAIESALTGTGNLMGVRILITAGATREPIDPVRFISNYSTGKMGCALAEAARDRGATVTILAGDISVPLPSHVEIISAPTADDMCSAAVERFENADVVISAAAIADYRPVGVADQKISKSDVGTGNMQLQLEKTPDLLETLGKLKQRQILVGFAAETQNMESRAMVKLKRKNMDLIVANDVTQEGAGFGADTNIVTLIHRCGASNALPKMHKREVAERILDEVSQLLGKTDK